MSFTSSACVYLRAFLEPISHKFIRTGVELWHSRRGMIAKLTGKLHEPHQQQIACFHEREHQPCLSNSLWW
jgi:hypothetical protein